MLGQWGNSVRATHNQGHYRDSSGVYSVRRLYPINTESNKQIAILSGCDVPKHCFIPQKRKCFQIATQRFILLF